MLEWLFGRKDTAESLTREVNSFFDRFRRLQARIEALMTTLHETQTEETHRNLDKNEELDTTLSKVVARANTVYDKAYAEEQERHADVLTDLTAEMESLRGSLRLATKVVNFAEE